MTGQQPVPAGGRRESPADDLAPGLGLVRARGLLIHDPLLHFPLALGDRPLVEPGDVVTPGMALIERARDAVLAVAPATAIGPDARSGDRLVGPSGTTGELVAFLDGRWRLAAGSPAELVEAPTDGTVVEVRPGVELSVAAAGGAIAASHVIGGPTRGRLEIGPPGDGDGRALAIDVGRAGTILVLDGRVDAEMLTRARAMGVRGAVVAGLSERDMRDVAASEVRQRASIHHPAPFAVLVLDGTLRRPMAEVLLSVLSAAAGRDVGISADPPALLLGAEPLEIPELDPLGVRIAHGPWAGQEGRWEGLAGLRRFRAGTHLEAGRVRFDDGSAALVPLADLERFA